MGDFDMTQGAAERARREKTEYVAMNNRRKSAALRLHRLPCGCQDPLTLAHQKCNDRGAL